jgi:hypothetical protein
MEGRSGSTQEHASKKEVAPADVTVIRIGNAEQGFHPGKKPHPGERRQAAAEPPQKAAYRRGEACQPPPQKYHRTPRKDRDGHAKAGQVHRGSGEDLRHHRP